ncbi:MAG: ankyrin repeat domain-containing protein [Bacteroidetes bacterium]|jgi:ankyrin repeat protein|nr:ankyrin repeat domain-containing protein [Phycisphaerae bacterium]NBC18367.1 ankyrin repeat domain-containing protein [Bacteroidota bacterium]
MTRLIALFLTALLLCILFGCDCMDATDASEEPQAAAAAPKQPMLSIHQAAATGDLDEVRSNLHYGIRLDARDAAGNTPLHHAAQAGRKNAVVLLAARGADVNARNNAGQTPLALSGETEIETYLVRMGGTK